MKNFSLLNFSLFFLIGCNIPSEEMNMSEELNEDYNELSDIVVMEDFIPNENLNWQVVNDGVMGGRSYGNLTRSGDSEALFSGNLSLENNGGFSSIRAYYPPNLLNVESIMIRVKGDGRKYSFRVRTNDSGWASYSHEFTTSEDEWVERELPLTSFYPTYRGYSLKNMPNLSELVIKEIGFMISDKITGKFELEIDWVKAK